MYIFDLHSNPFFVSVLRIIVLFISMAISLPSICNGHGLMSYPLPRGGTSGKSQFIETVLNSSHNTDVKLHFPAGDKSIVPGAAVRSQERNAGAEGWTLYDPFSTSFIWRYGVCGDLPDANEHLKYGIYYNDGQIVETFQSGDTLKIQMTMVAHHNGYIETYLCNTDNCPENDISPACFQAGHCVQLMRKPNPRCDDGLNKRCGPIDNNYPGRWYLPCPKNESQYIYGRKGNIQYQLPHGFYCNHCVLQFSWVSANFCNPPGYVDYFKGPNAPRSWNGCPGQGSARGGYNEKLPPCGGIEFSEEYLMCSDIQILSR